MTATPTEASAPLPATVEELIRYSESSEGKKLPPHPAYLEARRVLRQHAEVLAGQPMVTRVRWDDDQVTSAAPAPTMVAALIAVAVMSSFVIMTNRFAPASYLAPAVAALKERGVVRVLNDYDFGGYLIWSGIPVAIDGRTELYGERFMVELDDAMTLKSPDALFNLLTSQQIDATLLRRQTPAAQLLDHVDGWRKVFADENAVAHVRDPSARHTAEPEIKPASN